MRCALVRKKDTTPSIHDAFAERGYVFQHFKGNISACSDIRGCLEDLANYGQVSVELCPDSLSDVTECFQDCGLQLIGSALGKIVGSIFHLFANSSSTPTLRSFNK